ncbi:MAG: leucine-rich repeat protein [Pseudomonadota bacterium]|nr:leucine-rich repeat protein [Pseudomonadota bacterium]
MPFSFSVPMTLCSIVSDLDAVTDQTLSIEDIASLLEFFEQVDSSTSFEQEAALKLIEKKMILSDRQRFIIEICSKDGISEELRASFFRLVPGITEVTVDMIPYEIKEYIRTLDIPKGVSSIEDDMFYGCDCLESVSLPDGLFEIPTNAFYGCYNLSSIVFPNDLQKIDLCAFFNCENLERIDLPNGLKEIGDSAFVNCQSLNSVLFPWGLKEIGDSAFSGCISLKCVTLKYGIKKIGSAAFSGCIELKKISFPDSVEEIYGDAFLGCQGLKSVTLRNGLKKLGEAAFSECIGLTSIDLPDSVHEIGRHIFSGCEHLRCVNWSNGLSEIPSNAFYRCVRLNKINFPQGLTKIGDNAFQGCASFESLNLPDNIQEIGENAFADCSRLVELVVPLSFMSKDANYWMSRGISDPNIIQCRDAMYNAFKDENKSMQELIELFNQENISPVSADVALAYLKAFSDSRDSVDPRDCAEFLLKKVSDDEKQNFISAICDMESLPVEQRVAFFRLMPGITEVTKSMISEGVREGIASLEIPEAVTSIEEGAFLGCAALREIVSPLLLMGEDLQYWESRGLSSDTKVQCSDELYNAVTKPEDMHDIISKIKEMEDFNQETIAIYLKCAIDCKYQNVHVIELAKSMVDSGDLEILKKHLLYLFRGNRFDLFKDYEQTFGKQEVGGLLSSVVAENTKEFLNMVGGVPAHAGHKYLIINPQIKTDDGSCNVNVLLPFAGGSYGVVTDNTCKATLEMQKALVHGELNTEIFGYISQLEDFIGNVERFAIEGNTLIEQLKKIKSECENYLAEYNNPNSPMFVLKNQLLSGLEAADDGETNTQSSFPTPLKDYLTGNNNLYGAVFSVVDKDQGGTYSIDRYFRTTTSQTRPNEIPTAVCSFRRAEYLDAEGNFVNTGDVSPFAIAIAKEMNREPIVKREKLYDTVFKNVEIKMLQIGDDELDDAKVVDNLRLLIKDKGQELLDCNEKLASLETDRASLKTSPLSKPKVVSCITKFLDQKIIREYMQGNSEEKKGIIAELVQSIDDKMCAMKEKISGIETELDGYICFEDDTDMLVKLKDTELMKKAQDQFRRQEAVKRVFLERFPEVAKEKSWDDVFKDEHVDLNDIRSILSVLVNNWDDFENFYGDPNPFYDAMEDNNEVELGQKNANQLALFSQIAIARVNVMARSKDLSEENFGVILDDNLELCARFCDELKAAMAGNQDIEEAIVKFVNDRYRVFGMTRVLNSDEMQYCAKQIKVQINILKDSPHMDEHFFLGDKSPNPETVAYGGYISMPFVGLLSEDNRNSSHKAQLESFRQLEMQGTTLNVGQSLMFTKMVDKYPDIKLALAKRKISDLIDSPDDTFKYGFLKMAYFHSEKAYEVVDMINTLPDEYKQKFFNLFSGEDKEIVDTVFKRQHPQQAATTLQRVIRGYNVRKNRSKLPSLNALSVSTRKSSAADVQKQSADKKNKSSKKPNKKR